MPVATRMMCCGGFAAPTHTGAAKSLHRRDPGLGWRVQEGSKCGHLIPGCFLAFKPRFSKGMWLRQFTQTYPGKQSLTRSFRTLARPSSPPTHVSPASPHPCRRATHSPPHTHVYALSLTHSHTSLTHACVHTHMFPHRLMCTHSHSHTHTHPSHTHVYALSLTHSHTSPHMHVFTLTRVPAQTHTCTYSHSHSHTNTHVHMLTHSCVPAQTHMCSHCHSHTHTGSHTNTRSQLQNLRKKGRSSRHRLTLLSRHDGSSSSGARGRLRGSHCGQLIQLPLRPSLSTRENHSPPY